MAMFMFMSEKKKRENARSGQIMSRHFICKMSLKRKHQKYVLGLNALKELQKIKIQIEEEKNERKSPRFWVNPFLEKRNLQDIESNLLKDVLWEDGKYFQKFCRMTVDTFETLLALVEPAIIKQDTKMRYAITSKVRLAITLRFIATGDSYRSLEFLTHVSRKTISTFIPEVLAAVYDSLSEMNLKVPATQNEWLQIAKDFDLIWDFPHTLGALDGKHIRIKSPPNSGSDFYNYKGFFSVVLLAAVAAFGKFIFIDVGSNGRTSDTVIFKSCSFYDCLKSGKLNSPLPEKLKGQEEKTPYFLIGDGIFPLDTNIMKAFDKNSCLTVAQEVFNYRLSRARLTVEMTFGRLVSRFRIFHRPIEVSLNNCDLVVKGCCVLHNYLTKSTAVNVSVVETADWSLPETIIPLTKQDLCGYKYAGRYRDNLCKYVINDGNVP